MCKHVKGSFDEPPHIDTCDRFNQELEKELAKTQEPTGYAFVLHEGPQHVWKAVVDGNVLSATWQDKGAAEAGVAVEVRRLQRRRQKDAEEVADYRAHNEQADGPDDDYDPVEEIERKEAREEQQLALWDIDES